MRFSYFVLVVIYAVIDLGCVFACMKDIYSNLDKEQYAQCAVGEKDERKCITCTCVKKNTVVCTKTCDDVSPKDTKLCFRPKLEKRMTKKLSMTNIIENSYKSISVLAKDCKGGEKIQRDNCKCCICVCLAPGIASCKPELKGCTEITSEQDVQKGLHDSGENY